MNFSQDKFDAAKYVDEQMRIIDEKGMRRLVGELAEYRRVSADEMRKSVYANYGAFIRTSKEITELEVELQQMKNLLSVQTDLIQSLTSEGGAGSSSIGTAPSSLAPPGLGGEDEEGRGDPDDDIFQEEEKEPTEIEKYSEALPDILDILIAERKVTRAIELLEQGQQIVQLATNPQMREEEILGLEAASALEGALLERRTWLLQQLEEVAQHSCVRGQELRQAVAAISRLGETERAHQLLLAAYGERIRSGARAVRPSGTSYGGAYTAAVAQVIFSAISQAAADSADIFRDEAACAAELLLWAQRETEFCVSLLRRHVLSSAAAAGGLYAAGECVRIALGHCALLEDQGLCLTPVLAKLVRPSVEEALEFNIIRIEDSVTTMAAVDDWVLQPIPSIPRLKAAQQGLGSGSHIKLSSSAQRLYLLLVDLVEDLLPVISLQLFGRTLDRLAQLFESYVKMLQRALPLPPPEEEEGEAGGGGGGGSSSAWQGGNVRAAADEQQQLAVLGNASALADELLPRLALRLTLAAAEEKEAVGGGRGATTPMGRGGIGRGAGRMSESNMRRNSSGSAMRVQQQNLTEQKEWKRRLQKAVDKLRDLLCSCLVADFMYGDDGNPILTASEYLEVDAVTRPSQWMLKPMPSPPFQAMFLALHSISGTASQVLAGRERVVMLLLMRLAEWLMMGLMVYSSFWDELQGANYALGPTGLQQLVFDMYFVMQVAKSGKYSSRAMRKVAEDSATKAIVLFTEQSGGDPNSLLQEDWWYEHKCQEACEELLEMSRAAAEAEEEEQRQQQQHEGDEYGVEGEPIGAERDVDYAGGGYGGAPLGRGARQEYHR